MGIKENGAERALAKIYDGIVVIGIFILYSP
jgi:hypothetical protein